MKDEFLRLFQSTYGRPHGEQFFDWKYLNNPADFLDQQMVVAREGNTLIGVRPLLSIPLMLGDQRVRTAQPIDTIVAAEHRGKGVLVEMNKKALEYAKSRNVSAFFNFPNLKSRGAYLKQGWRQIGRLDNVYLILRRSASLFTAGCKLLTTSQQRPTPTSLSRLLGPSKDHIFRNMNNSVLSSEEWLTKHIYSRSSRLISLSDDLNFLRWRLVMHPGINYYFFSPRGSTYPDEYIIFCIIKRPDNLISVNIVDLMIDETYRVSSMLSHFIDFVTLTKCHIITFSGRPPLSLWNTFRSRKNTWVHHTPFFRMNANSTILVGNVLETGLSEPFQSSFFELKRWRATSLLQDTA